MQTLNDIILHFFNPIPGQNFQYYIPLYILIAILIILAAGIIVFSKRSKDNKAFKKLFRSYPSKLGIIAGLFIVYVSVRYYSVAFFSMRFLLYVLIAITIYIFYSMIKTYISKYPEEKKRREERNELNKYIPSKKKKKQ